MALRILTKHIPGTTLYSRLLSSTAFLCILITNRPPPTSMMWSPPHSIRIAALRAKASAETMKVEIIAGCLHAMSLGSANLGPGWGALLGSTSLTDGHFLLLLPILLSSTLSHTLLSSEELSRTFTLVIPSNTFLFSSTRKRLSFPGYCDGSTKETKIP